MNLEIVTPDGIILNKSDILRLSVMTEDGYITILKDHAEISTILVPGAIEVDINGEVDMIAIAQGLLRVTNNQITVLVDSANVAETIDETLTLEAKARAEALLANANSMDEENLSKIQADLSRELAKLSVLKFKRRSTI